MSRSESVGGYSRTAVAEGVVRLDLNESPREVGGDFRERFVAYLAEKAFNRYPDAGCRRAREAAAELYGWTVDGTLVGNGSNDLLVITSRVLLPPNGILLTLDPSFSMYPILAQRRGATRHFVSLIPPDFAIDEDNLLSQVECADMVVLTSPNNPTGGVISESLWDKLLATGKPMIWDGAYVELAGIDPVSLLAKHANLIVLRSLSKAWGLAGLRIGALLAGSKMVSRIKCEMLPFHCGFPVEAAYVCAAGQPALGAALVEEVVNERSYLLVNINRMNAFEVVSSFGNYFLLRKLGVIGEKLVAEIRLRGIAVRDVPELDAEGYVRVTVGDRTENDRLLAVLGEVAGE